MTFGIEFIQMISSLTGEVNGISMMVYREDGAMKIVTVDHIRDWSLPFGERLVWLLGAIADPEGWEWLVWGFAELEG